MEGKVGNGAHLKPDPLLTESWQEISSKKDERGATDD